MTETITKTEIYSIVWLFNQEIRKSLKTINFANVFREINWTLAVEEMERSAMFAKGGNYHELLMNKVIRAANALESGLLNMKTFKIYIFGEYIRHYKGCFLKRKKNGELYAPKGNGKKKKPVYNCLDLDAIGKLEGIDLYRPENLKSQTDCLKEMSEKVVSVLNLDVDQKNVLFQMLIDGKIGLHLYLYLWQKNEGFGIDEKKIKDEEYAKFIKMVKYLAEDGISLQDIYCHRSGGMR